MEYKEKKYILKKMMQGTLSKEEDEKLLLFQPVVKRMIHQLDNAEDISYIEKPNINRIWNNICKKIETKQDNSTQIKFYKTLGIAASFLLILSISSTIYFAFSTRNEITMNTLSTGLRNFESVTLADGTIVQVGSGSHLIYPSTFFGKTREVTLTGQAFFNVAKDAKKPFIVNTMDMKVKALGTAFEVFSYKGAKEVEAILLNGSIQVAVTDKRTGKETLSMVSPNERLIFNRNTGTSKIEKVDADNCTAWRNQQLLKFENEKLSVIIPRLEQWYNCKIVCNKELAEKYRYTFKVRDESLEQILFIILETSPLKYIKESNGDYTLISK